MNYSEGIYYDSILANKLLPIIVVMPRARAWMNERANRTSTGTNGLKWYCYLFGQIANVLHSSLWDDRRFDSNNAHAISKGERPVSWTSNDWPMEDNSASINYSISKWKLAKAKGNGIDFEHLEQPRDIFRVHAEHRKWLQSNDCCTVRRIKWQI